MNIKKDFLLYYIKSGLLFSLILFGLAYSLSKMIDQVMPYIINSNLTLIPAILYSIGYIVCYLIIAIIAQEITKKIIKKPIEQK